MIPYIVLGIIVFFLLFVVFLLFVPVRILVSSDNIFLYKMKFLWFSFDISVEKILSKKGIFGIDFILMFLVEKKKFLRKRFNVKKLDFFITIGTSEASTTAIITGYLYGIVYSVIALLDTFLYIPKPNVVITPKFNEAALSMSLNGIIKTRIVHIIATALIFAYKFLKYKKEEKEEK